MKKGIFSQAWEEAMQRHKVYKKENLKKIEIIQEKFKEDASGKSAGFLGGIGLYYLHSLKDIFKKIFKGK